MMMMNVMADDDDDVISTIKAICSTFELNSNPFIASYQTFEPTEVQEAYRQLYRKIQGNLNESKQSQNLLETCQEDLQKHSEAFEKHCQLADEELSILKSEHESTKHHEQSLEMETHSLKDQLYKLHNDFERLAQSDPEHKAIIDRLENEKLELYKIIESKNTLLSSSEEESNHFKAKLRSCKDEIEVLQNELAEHKSKTSMLQVGNEHIQKENERYKRLLDKNAKEIEELLLKLSQSRKEKSIELGTLKQNWELCSDENKSLKDSNHQLKHQLTECHAKIDEYLSQMHQLKDSHVESEENFKREMSTQIKLANLYKESFEDLNSKLPEFEEQMKESRLAHEVEKRDLESALNEQGLRLKDLEIQLRNRDEEYELIKNRFEDLQSVNDSNSHSMDSSVDQTVLLSPTAKAVERLQKKGKSFVQVFKENLALSHSLQVERSENERMKATLNEILAELNSVQMQYQNLLNELNEYRNAAMAMEKDLTETTSLLKIKEKESQESKNETRRLSEANTALQQEVKDLSLQVRELLSQIEGIPVDMEREGNDEGRPLTADDIVSTRCITFKDLSGLQVRNQELVRLTRELTKKLDTLEYERQSLVTSEVNKKLALAMEKVKVLEEERQQVQLRVEELLQQRDVLQDTLKSSAIIGDDENSMRQLKEEYAQYKRQRGEMDVLLHGKIDQLQENMQTVTLEKSKLEHSLLFANERLTLSQTQLKYRDEELKELRSRNGELFNQVSSYTMKLDALMEQHMDYKNKLNEAESLLREAKNEKANIELEFQKVLEKYQIDVAETQGLKLTLKKLNEDIMDKEKEWQNTQKILKAQTSVTEDALRETRKEITSLAEDLKLANYKVDKEKDYWKVMMDKLEKEKDRLEVVIKTKEAEAAELLEKKAEVEARLTDSERRVDLLLSLIQKRSTMMAATPVIKDMDHLKDGGGHELLDQYVKLQKSIDHYQRSYETTNEELENVRATLEKQKLNSESNIFELKNQIRAYEQELSEKAEKLSAIQRELESVQSQLETFQQQRQQENNEYHSKMAILNAEKGQAITQLETLKGDLEKQLKLFGELETRYSNQVILHGQDLQKIQVLATEKEKLLEEFDHVRLTFTEQQESIKSAALKEAEYKQTIMQKAEEIKNLQEHNGKLYDQLKLSGGTDGLGGLIHYLRKEKELLNLQLDLQSQENKRLKLSILSLNQTVADLTDKLKTTEASDKASEADYATISKDYNDLLEKVNQLQLFRESNSTLRHENKILTERLTRLEKELKDWKEKSQSIENERRETLSENEALKVQFEQARNDVLLWRNKLNQFIQESKEKATDVTQTEEYLACKEELLAVQKHVEEKEEELKTSQEQLLNIKVKNENIQKRFKEIKENWATEKESLLTQNNQLVEQVTDLKAKLDESGASETRANSLQQTIDEQSIKLTKAATLAKNYQTLKQELTVAQSELNKEKEEGQNKLAELELKTSVVVSQWKAKLEKASQTNRALETELGTLKDELGKRKMTEDGEKTTNSIKKRKEEEEEVNKTPQAQDIALQQPDSEKEDGECVEDSSKVESEDDQPQQFEKDHDMTEFVHLSSDEEENEEGITETIVTPTIDLESFVEEGEAEESTGNDVIPIEIFSNANEKESEGTAIGETGLIETATPAPKTHSPLVPIVHQGPHVIDNRELLLRKQEALKKELEEQRRLLKEKERMAALKKLSESPVIPSPEIATATTIKPSEDSSSEQKNLIITPGKKKFARITAPEVPMPPPTTPTTVPPVAGAATVNATSPSPATATVTTAGSSSDSKVKPFTPQEASSAIGKAKKGTDETQQKQEASDTFISGTTASQRGYMRAPRGLLALSRGRGSVAGFRKKSTTTTHPNAPKPTGGAPK